jgi:hypothetical protein
MDGQLNIFRSPIVLGCCKPYIILAEFSSFELGSNQDIDY